MVQSLKGPRYITSMGTQAIMQSQILKCCPLSIMCTNIQNPMNFVNGVKCIWQRIRKSAKHGIGLRKGTNGMLNTQHPLNNKWNTLVSNVVPNSLQRSGTTASVPINAKVLGGEIQAWTMSNAFVRYVGRNSQSTNIAKQNAVPLRVQRVTGPIRKEDVYNITVEIAHDYFANGILVKNCDALRYCTSALFQMGHTKVVEAKGVNVIEGSLGKEEAPAEPVPKPRHTRVCSTHGSENENPVPSLFRFF